MGSCLIMCPIKLLEEIVSGFESSKSNLESTHNKLTPFNSAFGTEDCQLVEALLTGSGAVDDGL